MRYIFVMTLLLTMVLNGCATVPLEEEIRTYKKDYDFDSINRLSIFDFQDYQEGDNSGKVMSNEFMKHLIHRGYDVIESSRLKDVLEIKKLAVPEEIDIDLMKKLHDVIKVDVLITGIVTEFSRGKEEEIELPEKDRKSKYSSHKKIVRYDAEVGVTVRMVDVKTGGVILVDSDSTSDTYFDDALKDLVSRILDVMLLPDRIEE